MLILDFCIVSIEWDVLATLLTLQFASWDVLATAYSKSCIFQIACDVLASLLILSLASSEVHGLF